jgi:KipI family sensor histidine kinase inhibitor
MSIPSDKPEIKLKAEARQIAAGNTGMAEVSRETEPLRWMTDRGICVATGANTLGTFRRIDAMRLPGIVEIVPADGMLLVVLEPGARFPPGLLDILNSMPPQVESAPTNFHPIPVRFDGEDFREVAERAGCSPGGLVESLCSLTLRVKFLGFQPGFAYLEGLPPELHLPRRANPRKQVPAGSVAVGGGYCGIYPAAGPGGWHLLGTTDVRLFAPAASPPARFQPGDTVKLVAA